MHVDMINHKGYNDPTPVVQCLPALVPLPVRCQRPHPHWCFHWAVGRLVRLPRVARRLLAALLEVVVLRRVLRRRVLVVQSLLVVRLLLVVAHFPLLMAHVRLVLPQCCYAVEARWMQWLVRQAAWRVQRAAVVGHLVAMFQTRWRAVWVRGCSIITRAAVHTLLGSAWPGCDVRDSAHRVVRRCGWASSTVPGVVMSRFLLDVVSLTTLAVRSTASSSPSAALSWFCNQCAMVAVPHEW